MINSNDIAKVTARTIKKHAPQIFTGIGIVLSVSASIFSAKATIKAEKIISEMKEENSEPSKEDVVKAVWKEYIPAASLLVMSAVCIIGSSSVSVHRTAALGAAYSLSESKFAKYRDKVNDMLGEGKEKDIHDNVVIDSMNTDVSPENDKKSESDILFYDVWSGRYFYSDRSKVDRAINEVNSILLKNGDVCLNDFYDAIHIRHTKAGYEYSWNVGNCRLIDIRYTAQIAENGEPCLAVDFFQPPMVMLPW